MHHNPELLREEIVHACSTEFRGAGLEFLAQQHDDHAPCTVAEYEVFFGVFERFADDRAHANAQILEATDAVLAARGRLVWRYATASFAGAVSKQGF